MEKKNTDMQPKKVASPVSSPRRRIVVLGGIGGGGRYEPSEREVRRARKGPEGFEEEDVYKHVVEGKKPASQKPKVKKTGTPVIDASRFINRAVAVEEEAAYIPKHKFADFKVATKLKENIAKKGYVLPTAIQDQTIIHALEGRDVIGIANTGEGKTAAFLIPLINKLVHEPKAKFLVITPTRELAVQIADECKSFVMGTNIFAALLIGGQSMGYQKESLKRGARVIIGTPGRIKDHIEKKTLDLTYVHNFVLDEADRMLDMGFVQDIREIIKHMPAVRQSLFFSATFAKEIEQLAHSFLRDPVRISVKRRETNKNIDQDVIFVTDSTDKFHKLAELLKKPEVERAIIFTRTKSGAERVGRILKRSDFAAEAIHGDKVQRERLRALKNFKDGKTKFLVATDVAARGLDIPDVSHVINYDAPENYDDYVHRIGRTGRAGKKGIAYTFVEKD
jgi:ATP-dependent RNA helicase RhlE